MRKPRGRKTRKMNLSCAVRYIIPGMMGTVTHECDKRTRSRKGRNVCRLPAALKNGAKNKHGSKNKSAFPTKVNKRRSPPMTTKNKKPDRFAYRLYTLATKYNLQGDAGTYIALERWARAALERKP